MPRGLDVNEATEGLVESGGERCTDVRALVIGGRVSLSKDSATVGDCKGEVTFELDAINGNSGHTGGRRGVVALLPTASSSSAGILLAFSIDIAPRL